MLYINDKMISFDDYLKLNINYTWVQIIRLSMQYNISVKRQIQKMIKTGALIDIGKYGIDDLSKYIEHKLHEIDMILISKNQVMEAE